LCACWTNQTVSRAILEPKKHHIGKGLLFTLQRASAGGVVFALSGAPSFVFQKGGSVFAVIFTREKSNQDPPQDRRLGMKNE
jgi:hypothetical protein